MIINIDEKTVLFAANTWYTSLGVLLVFTALVIYFDRLARQKQKP